MEQNNQLIEAIRVTVIARKEGTNEEAPIAISKEEMVREMQEKYPAFSKFDIENAFEQLKIDEHVEEHEDGDTYLFTEAFIYRK